MAALTLIAAASSVSGQSGSRASDFAARITTVPISPAERSTVTGRGAATARLDGQTLHVRGSFEGLQGPATTGALHQSPVLGVRGPLLAELAVTGAASGELTGDIELDASGVDALRAGRLYVQVNSAAAPDGNLWGWLLAPERRR